MYLAGRWYAIDLSAATPADDSRASGLDVALLRAARAASDMLGIGDIRSDKRIDFVGGARGVAGTRAGAVNRRRGGGRLLDVSGDDRRFDGDLRRRRHHAAEVDLVRAKTA